MNISGSVEVDVAVDEIGKVKGMPPVVQQCCINF